MKKTKFCWLLLTVLGLCGCAAKETTFTLTSEQQEQYIALMASVADKYYWDFDKDSLQFMSGTIPKKSKETEDLFAASLMSEYDLSAHQNENVVIGTANLVHYNGDDAGQLLCYFSGNHVIGACYQGGYDNGYYGLTERNSFLTDVDFAKYENWNGMEKAFSSTSAAFPKEGFLTVGKDSKGNVLMASIQNGSVRIYRYQKNVLRLWKTLTFGNGLEATSATFFDGQSGSELAVLLSSVEEHGSGEGEYTFTKSKKIVFYDVNMKKTNVEIPLETGNAGALAADGDTLFLSVDKTIQYYQNTEEGWQNTGYTRLKHGVQYIHITDLDNNGTKEYLMSDGLDLYLYQKNDTNFRKLWSTHLGVESLYGVITSGDLNQDGIKEIYICDMTGTTIRYILTKKGLRSSNEDIVYAQCIYPIDLNVDGLDDYWLVTDIEARNGSLCIAKGE